MNTRDKSDLKAPEPPISEAAKAELLRRRASLDQDRKTARPWSEIYADQLRRHAEPR